MPLSKHRKKERVVSAPLETSTKKSPGVYIFVYLIIGLMLLSLLSLFFTSFTTSTQ